VAGVAQASLPLFTAPLALKFKAKGARRPAARRDRGRLVGVGVLTGVDPGKGGGPSRCAVLLSSLPYSAGGLFGQTQTATVSGPVLAAARRSRRDHVLPWGLFDLPSHMPGWKPSRRFVLALAGTAFAQLLLFHVLRVHGAAKVSLVAYLMPPFALFYGSTILGEPVRWSAIAGLLLILLGVALGSGGMALRRRRRTALRTAP
jgi:hypothetical protein